MTSDQELDMHPQWPYTNSLTQAPLEVAARLRRTLSKEDSVLDPEDAPALASVLLNALKQIKTTYWTLSLQVGEGEELTCSQHYSMDEVRAEFCKHVGLDSFSGWNGEVCDAVEEHGITDIQIFRIVTPLVPNEHYTPRCVRMHLGSDFTVD